ncbi:MAG: tyrosine-type recombinase/integrase [Thermoleophilia bacterium]
MEYLRPSTLVSYKGHVEKHIIPALGTVPLQKLFTKRIGGFYESLLVGKADGPDLTHASVRRVHATLHRALRDARDMGYVSQNAADKARVPRAPKNRKSTKLRVWSLAELQTFLAAVQEDRLYPLWVLLATTGMRRGEALGLTWKDLDSGTARIHGARVCVGYEVRMGETKTGYERDVDLDPGTMRVLKAWRKRQIAERWKWKELWTDTGLVFTQEDGTGWHPNRITKLFGNAIAKVQKDQEKEAERIKDEAPKILPRIRLHDLRHGAASLALQNGEPIVVVS